MTQPKRLARIAGLLYLLLAIFGGTAHLYARASVHEPGDAAATTANIVSNAGLFRYGFVADLFAMALFPFVGFALYLLLRHVHEDVARAMVVFVALSVAIAGLNLIHHFGALLVATESSYVAAMGSESSAALVLLLVDLHEYGYLIAQVFFGLWLLPLGYLAYRSGMFPRTLGIMLIVACFSYLVDLVALFAVPGVGETISPFVVAPAAIGEFWMIGYLLVKGVRTPASAAPVLVAA